MNKVIPYGELDTFPLLRGLSLPSICRNAHKAIILVTLLFMFAQPAIGKDIKPDLSSDDYRQIMELADRIEAAFLIPDALLLLEVVRPEHGLFIDILGDSKDYAVVVKIPFEGVQDIFKDFEEKYWGPHDAADFDLYGAVPYVLLCGSIHLVAQYPEDKDHYSRIVSLPDAFSRYQSKEIDQLVKEPANHFFAYDEEHYVQYFVQGQGNELDAEFWFLIVDQDERGWFLKGLVRIEYWVI